MEPHLYNVTITWNTDRKGTMCSPDLNINGNVADCVDVATPPEFPKGIPGIWSPEHLFTAAVGSCLMTTFLAIAENSKLDFISFSCDTKGKLEKVDGKLAMSEVVLEPVVTIKDEASREKGLKVLQKAEANCLITNSVACKVSMVPKIIVLSQAVSA
jgi:organic hydroperoxide reductase OsmC/OhrA